MMWIGLRKASSFLVPIALLLAAALVCLSACASRNASGVQSAPRAAAAQVSAVLAPVRPHRLLLEPDDGMRPLIRLIGRAQTQIFVEDYILTERHVVRALERAAAQGVRVYVLLEPHPLGMGNQPQRMANELRAAGISVRWAWARYPLTHTKLLVLDDRKAVISTANLSRSGFTSDRDALVVDTDRGDVRALSGLFRADWDHLPAGFLSPHLVVSPENGRSALSRLMESAHRSLWIYAEELADRGIVRLLVAAAARGVDVRVLLPSPPAAGQVRRISIRMLQRPYVHAKVVLVDGRMALLGSENLSSQSLDRNREVGVFIHGNGMRRLVHAFQRDWRRANTSRQVKQ